MIPANGLAILCKELCQKIEVYSFSNKYQRVIVITDEQSHDGVITLPEMTGYIINVASNRNGVGYEKGWTHINGLSEAVFDYLREIERELHSS